LEDEISTIARRPGRARDRAPASQKALLIVRLTRWVSALQAELPTNVPTLVELKSMNGLAKVAVWPAVRA
jgi:hypothetical protein